MYVPMDDSLVLMLSARYSWTLQRQLILYRLLSMFFTLSSLNLKQSVRPKGTLGKGISFMLRLGLFDLILSRLSSIDALPLGGKR